MRTQTKIVFTTELGLSRQKSALAQAPESCQVIVLGRPDKATLIESLVDADYLISERVGTIDAQVLQSSPRLKLIQRLGSLTHDIDLVAAQSAGIAVCDWPSEVSIRVAEHVVMQLLAVGKKLREVEDITRAASPEWGKSQRTTEDIFSYNWSGRRGINQLWRHTIGIMGLGEIGVEVARRLQGWGCTLIYHKRRQLPARVESELALTYASPNTLYAQSDYVVNLLPYLESTDMLINAEAVAHMKPGAYLVSCGSGSVIDEAALATAVAAGKLAGVAVDTYEWEPIQADNPLLGLARDGFNIVLTPQTAAAGSVNPNNLRAAYSSDYTNIINHLLGNPLLYRIV